MMLVALAIRQLAVATEVRRMLMMKLSNHALIELR